MKKLLILHLSFLFVICAYSQQEYSLQQLTAAMNCRMIKVTDGKAIIFKDEVPEYGEFISFKLLYGGQSSGYSSDDNCILLSDNTEEWNKKHYLSISAIPTEFEIRKQTTTGKQMNSYIFGSNDCQWTCSIFDSFHPESGQKSENAIGIKYRDKNLIVSFSIHQCDFYDISSGQAKLVLKGYEPWRDDYTNRNLLRIFFDKMYKYYHK